MDAILGVGIGAGPRPSGAFDVWLPVLVLLALLLFRVIGGLRITVPVAAAAAVGGILWAVGRDAFGVIPSAAGAVLVAYVAGTVIRRVAARRIG